MKRAAVVGLLALGVTAWAAACRTAPVAALPEIPAGRGEFEDILVGSQAIDFALRDLYGKTRRLSELTAETVVVLEFASMTCPHYVNTLRELGALSVEYRTRDVMFVTVYTSEAHPEYLDEAERPKTWDDRRDLAARSGYAYDYQERGRPRRASGAKPPGLQNRLILVDDLPSVVGDIYGHHPERACHPAFIVDRDGRIAAKTRRLTAAFVEENLPKVLGR